jgi:hypothetical protein
LLPLGREKLPIVNFDGLFLTREVNDVDAMLDTSLDGCKSVFTVSVNIQAEGFRWSWVLWLLVHINYARELRQDIMLIRLVKKAQKPSI